MVVVVLGAPNGDDGSLSPQAESRVAVAVRELAERAGSVALPTGGFGEHFNRTTVPHHEYLRQALVASGVGDERILPGVPSTNTAEDALGVRDALAGATTVELVVVTSDFHARRARWHFERALGDRAVTFVAAPSDGIDDAELERLRVHERTAMERLA